MNAKNIFSAKILLCVSILIVSGCSKSDKETIALPDIISTIYFPYIKNSSLYSFEPETGESKLLVQAETDLFLALDTDAGKNETSEDNNGDSIELLTQTATAEYIVYAQKQSLHLYDLDTQYDHNVFSFKADQFNPDAGESYICDIQKVITLDDESRLSRRVLFKDELKVYVKTSTNINCSEPEEGFNYWQIDLEESNDSEEIYTIRRKTLLSHTHKHLHFHDHDDTNYIYADEHTHEHTLEKDDKDENGLPFDPNYHIHSHSHSHDFVYGFEHAHELHTKDEIDEVHNNPLNQEIIFEEHPFIIGRKSTIESIDEALMYSGTPVVDIDNRNYGYLGINSKDHSLKFYSVNLDTLEKRFSWATTNSNLNTFTNIKQAISDFEKIIPSSTRHSIFSYANDNVLLTSQDKLFYFKLNTLFDDDQEEARQKSITEPLYVSFNNSSLYNKINYNAITNKMTINEGSEVWTIDFSDQNDVEPRLITKVTAPNLSVFYAFYMNENVVLTKEHSDNDLNEFAFVSLTDTGLEDRTLISKNPDEFYLRWYPDQFSVKLINYFTGYVSSSFYDSILSETHSNLENAFWTMNSKDYRNYTTSYKPFILISNTPGAVFGSLDSPGLFKFDSDNLEGKGESFGIIPQDVTTSPKAVIFNNLFGYIEVQLGKETTTYFFSNEEKSSFNFDNEFEIMKPLTPPPGL